MKKINSINPVEIIFKEVNDDFLIIKGSEQTFKTFITHENACKALMEAGIIDDFDNEVVMIDYYEMEGINYEEVERVNEYEIVDFLFELTLEQCARVQEVFYKNKCYLTQEQLNEIPF